MQNETSSHKIKIILTGGHLAPLLAVLSVLQKKANCVVIGRKFTFEADKTVSLEYNLFKDSGVTFYNLPAGRLQRKFTKHTIPSVMRFPRSFLVARSILKRERPGAVLTFGGYVGLPVALAAKSLKIPVVLHEQTQKVGLTNRIIAKTAAVICISFPGSGAYFPENKVVLTGNPLRPEIFRSDAQLEVLSDKPILFVTGGSTGSHTINTYIEYLLLPLLEHFVIIHQTGDAREFQDFERLVKLRSKLPKNLQKDYLIKKYIMPSEAGWVYKHADVVLGRAGANTVSELIALQKKALLIPLRYGQKKEQLENAKYYEKTGLGTYVLEQEVHLKDLLPVLIDLEKKHIPLKKSMYSENSAQKIANLVLEEARGV